MSLPLTATEALRAIRDGRLSRADYLQTCLAIVESREANVRAFASLDVGGAMRAARVGDETSADGMLSGIPIAVKDILDTEELPTEFNSPLYEGHRPAKDAACVAALRAEGAIVLGKAATVEFASRGQVASTVNPYNALHTPGGTSSGSAAAVATGMVPIALGTQTGGSTIRPASFCGVAGLKPTFGTVPIDGMKPYAPTLDTIGWMARSVDDLALVARALRISLDTSTLKDTPRIGFYRTAYWEEADGDVRDALDWARQAFLKAGAVIDDVAALPGDDRLNEAQDVIMHGEGRVAYLPEYLRWRDRLHEGLREDVENAEGYDGSKLRWAYDYLGMMRQTFDQAMAEYHAWLTPAVPGEAPVGLEETGEATFNRLWTGLHTPAITLPGFLGQTGLPVGIQLVGRRFADATLLSVAEFAERALGRYGLNHS